MKVGLSRFRVKPDKSARVDEWLKMLNEDMDELVQTLEREQMKLEVIFREIIDGEEYLLLVLGARRGRRRSRNIAFRSRSEAHPVGVNFYVLAQ